MIALNEKILEGTWWYRGCAMKLLLYLVEKARGLGQATVEYNRRVAAADLGESEWAVRLAYDLLKSKGIIHQITAQRKVGTTIGFTGDYVCVMSDPLPNTAQSKGKKKGSSPKNRPNTAQINSTVTDSKSDGLEGTEGAGSPISRPNTAQKKDKEIIKENSPHTPYIENNKETECPNGRLAPGPDSPPPLNQRARLCFEETFRELYHSEYYWTAKDAGQMTQLLNKIRFSREKRKNPLPTDDDALIEALKKFLLSINKDWISNNFSVSMIASHYNEIISEIKNRNNSNNGRKTSADTASVARRTQIASNIASYDEQWRREHGTGEGTGA